MLRKKVATAANQHTKQSARKFKNKCSSLLGQGTYGYVHKVDMDGDTRALKYFVSRKNEHFLNNLHELDIMNRLNRYPNLVRLLHISLDDPQEFLKKDEVYKKDLSAS